MELTPDITRHEITIVGCGPGGEDYLLPAGLKVIQAADVLAGSPRLLEAFAAETQTKICMKGGVTALLDELTPHVGSKKIAVLVTGDPGLYSLSRNVISRFGREICRVIPGVSSIQTAFARVALDWQDALIISAHGRTPVVEPGFAEGRDKIAVLAGGEASRKWLYSLSDALGDRYQIVVCSNLTLANERVEYVSASELETVPLASKSVVLFIDEGCK